MSEDDVYRRHNPIIGYHRMRKWAYQQNSASQRFDAQACRSEYQSARAHSLYKRSHLRLNEDIDR